MTDIGSTRYAFFQGEIVPLEEAKVSVMTHALNYGTGVFEGIRGYWNESLGELFIFRLREHYERFLRNCKMMFIHVPYSLDELVSMTVELVKKNNFSGDIYLRPLAYKSSEQIGVSMEGVADDLTIFVVPFGDYVDTGGLSVCVSSWKRSDDNAIPGRAKITGNYVNSALIKNEAKLNGFDEGIALNQAGFVVEGSAENIFIVRNRTLLTPSVADGILEGITRDTVITIAREQLDIPTIQRQVARTELYYADEIFLCGTGAQIAPVTCVDHLPVGNGEIGPISAELQHLYFDVVRGCLPKYSPWLTPVNGKKPVAHPTAVAS